MKLSFVIPAFNEESSIGSCIESIQAELKRNPCDAEIIVVDNASTDKTAEVASAYAGVAVVREPVKGLVAARACGYAASSGELIANIDADNRLPEGWVTTVLAEFARSCDVVAVTGPLIYYDLSPWYRFLVRVYYFLAYIAYFATRRLIQGGNFVLRRNALDAIGGFNKELSFWGEDADIARRIAQHGVICFTLRLPIYSSGRRIAKSGLLETGYLYAKNYFWIIFTGHPRTQTRQKDIR